MSKAKYERKNPHVNVGTIGHVDHGKTTLTASIVAVQSKDGMAQLISYKDIAKGGTERDETKTVTIASARSMKLLIGIMPTSTAQAMRIMGRT